MLGAVKLYQHKALDYVQALKRRLQWGAHDGQSNWWTLKPVGKFPLLKVSYISLIALPFISSFQEFLDFLGLSRFIQFCTFFASFLLALANLAFDIGCPVIIRRFDSPNDLYRSMLEIKTFSHFNYPEDKFNATFDHCKNSY